MKEFVPRLVEARLHSYSRQIQTWQDLRAIRDRLHAEMESDLAQTTARQFGMGLMARFPQEGLTDPSSYMDSVTQLSDGLLALTGIRFRGGDPRKPFVEVAAIEGAVTVPRLHDVIGQLDAKWGRFSPLCVRIPVPSTEEVVFDSFGPNSRVDLQIVAGRVSDILAKQPGRVDGLSVAIATDTSWFEQYQREYARYLSIDLRRREWTTPESYVALADATERGAVFLVKMHDELAGIYSMPPSTGHGLRGFRVQEKILFESGRGRGLGASVEHAVISQLPAYGDEVVFGSIEAGNLPSLRSAERVGRRIIGLKLWLTPTNRPGMPA